jgi:hypothetical protein
MYMGKVTLSLRTYTTILKTTHIHLFNFQKKVKQGDKITNVFATGCMFSGGKGNMNNLFLGGGGSRVHWYA